jgi:mRNA-degrading endonuclease toxin of MazEF toxin-antitoxin module
MYQIVKLKFPFADDFEKDKPRPALVISRSFGIYNQTILAYITTDQQDKLETDIFLDSSKQYFSRTGLRSSSVIKLHRLVTAAPSQIGEVMGILPDLFIPELKKKMKKSSSCKFS